MASLVPSLGACFRLTCMCAAFAAVLALRWRAQVRDGELLPLVIELHHAALVNLQRRPDLDVLR